MSGVVWKLVRIMPPASSEAESTAVFESATRPFGACTKSKIRVHFAKHRFICCTCIQSYRHSLSRQGMILQDDDTACTSLTAIGPTGGRQ